MRWNRQGEEITFSYAEIDELKKLIDNCHLNYQLDSTLDLLTFLDPCFCNCGSCGEVGCCPPDKCNSLYNLLNLEYLEKYLSEKEELYYIDRPNPIFHILEELRIRFNKTDGLYCDYNIKSYREMEQDYYELYSSCKTLLDKLEIIEVSDSGKEFHPNQITSCRVLDSQIISDSLVKIKSIIGE